MTKPESPKGECQICGRKIKVKRGGEVLALHGYKRPSAGWQTASCPGSRHQPYEVSCDQLPKAIGRVSEWQINVEVRLRLLRLEPPPTVQGEEYRGSGRYKKIDVERPPDFDPKAAVSHKRNAYDVLYANLLTKLALDIQSCQRDKVYFEKRLADWKAPAAAVEAHDVA